jgi:hypothetical protein
MAFRGWPGCECAPQSPTTQIRALRSRASDTASMLSSLANVDIPNFIALPLSVGFRKPDNTPRPIIPASGENQLRQSEIHS